MKDTGLGYQYQVISSLAMSLPIGKFASKSPKNHHFRENREIREKSGKYKNFVYFVNKKDLSYQSGLTVQI